MNLKSNPLTITTASLLVGLLAGCQAAPQAQPEAQPTAPPAATLPKIEATPAAVNAAYQQLAESEQAIANEWSQKTFEDFEATVYREPDTGVYIVNGDTPIIDRKHLQEFFENDVQKAGAPSAGLVVHQVGGVDAAWADHEKHGLSYCVSDSFGTRQAAVITDMAAATGAWEAVADVDFIHVTSEDGNCTNTNNQVLFDVRPNSSGQYLARAFFPDDPRSRRNVLIDDSSFTLDPNGNLTLEGILRHELGHVLGFRHEHTRPESGACFEDSNWRELTSYDAFSVMHYPQCNGQGDWSLNLTAMDRSGAACLYGAAPGFTIDSSICTPPTAPLPPCGEQTVTESGTLGQGEEVHFGPYSTAPGSQFRVVMSGQGDPDLYVRYLIPPTTTEFDCRPYLSGPTETCDLTVPVNKVLTAVMVRGYSAADYSLTITHTPAQSP